MSTPDSSKMDFFELGDKTSLVCADAASVNSVRSVLRELDFKIHTAETADSAIERIQYTRYDCIVIHENFAGSSLRANPVLSYFAPLPMAQRRNSFVCLLGPSFKTLDAMEAFAQSVHVVVNPVDLPNMTAILRKCLAEFELQYRLFREVLSARGEQ